LLSEKIPVVFLIAGDGPLRSELETKAAEIAPQGGIRFLGFRRDTAALLKLMDVFTMSSVDEGLPMAMIEAMASRTPVVVTSVGDIPKVIEDGVNGMLVKPRDSEMLAMKIRKLISDPQLRDNLAARAFQNVKDRYSKEAMCSKYIEVYDEVLSR